MPPSFSRSRATLSSCTVQPHHKKQKFSYVLYAHSQFLCSLASFKLSTVGSGARRKFSWRGFSFSGLWWSLAFVVRCLWRHNLKSYSLFQTNVLARFVDIICIFFYIHSPYFKSHSTKFKLSALQVRLSDENKLTATTQQFITTKYQAAR